MSLNPTPPDTAGGNGLLGCPFCGGKANLIMTHLDHWIVQCSQCSVQQDDPSVYDQGADAIAAWNRRALPPMGNVRSWRFENYGGDHSRIYEGVEAIASVEHHEAQPLCDRHNAEVAALTQALTNLRRERQWRQISEAPKDGTEVLGYHPEWVHEEFCPEGVRSCIHDGEEWHSSTWRDDDFDILHHGNGEPLLWQPLPAAPLPAPQQAE